jgi:hypothetical protein
MGMCPFHHLISSIRSWPSQHQHVSKLDISRRRAVIVDAQPVPAVSPVPGKKGVFFDTGRMRLHLQVRHKRSSPARQDAALRLHMPS